MDNNKRSSTKRQQVTDMNKNSNDSNLVNFLEEFGFSFFSVSIGRHLFLKKDSFYFMILILKLIENFDIVNSLKEKENKNYIGKFLEKISNIFKKQYNTDSLLVSIDKMGFSKRLNPLYSWSVRGKTKYIKNKIVSVKNRNISVCSCITSNGDIKYEISNKPFNRESFLSFLQNLNFPKGTILLIDNVSFHHSKIVKEYITEKGWISLYIHHLIHPGLIQ